MNIRISLFNSWHKRGSLVQRGLEKLGYSERLNQHMHNKLFAVDNRIAIIGGRNIGDAHFGLSDKYNLRDLDVIVAGPMVDKVSDSFDLYWNDEWTVSASASARPDRAAPLQEHMLHEGAALLERKWPPRAPGASPGTMKSGSPGPQAQAQATCNRHAVLLSA
jgi:putative cardiolipin synthase